MVRYNLNWQNAIQVKHKSKAEITAFTAQAYAGKQLYGCISFHFIEIST